MAENVQVRGAYGKPFAKLLQDGIPVTNKLLHKMGKCLVDAIHAESKKDFARRGWSGKDPHGGPVIWESFSYRIKGVSTVEILSSFYGMAEMGRGAIPDRKMTWLTQEAKEQHPEKYPLTEGEKKRGMRQSGRVSKGERLPLVVPIKSKGGAIVLRMAPLKIGNAWVHPGIAKFTFLERGIRKGREACAEAIKSHIVNYLSGTST